MFATRVKFHSGRVDASGDIQVPATPDCVCKFLEIFSPDASVTLRLTQRAVSICVLTLCLAVCQSARWGHCGSAFRRRLDADLRL